MQRGKIWIYDLHTSVIYGIDACEKILFSIALAATCVEGLPRIYMVAGEDGYGSMRVTVTRNR